MIDVTVQNFETEVIAASMSTPVLVDFWAPWCGPCKSLSPILEKLEVDYGGRFILAKVNSDEQQELAGAFGIRSIPTCILLVGGRPVDGFAGALPEGQLRQFLDQHLPSEEALQAEAETAEAEALAAAGDVDSAAERLADALAKDPANDDARYDYVRLLLMQQRLDEADALLGPTRGRIPVALRFEALDAWLQALRAVRDDPHASAPRAELQARIEANRRDFDARLAIARQLIAQGQWPEAMDELLEIIMRDKAWADEAPRKTYVALLELMTPPKPKAEAAIPGKSAGGIELMGRSAVADDPQTELVSRYRRKLSMALN